MVDCSKGVDCFPVGAFNIFGDGAEDEESSLDMGKETDHFSINTGVMDEGKCNECSDNTADECDNDEKEREGFGEAPCVGFGK